MAQSCIVIVSSFLVFCMALPCLATVYTVGDTTGWTTGEDYTSWTSGKTFVVGDSLAFNYVGGHTVNEVAESDYKTCTASNSISTDSSGSTSVDLTKAGTRYFICGITGHCGSGMKLSVTVASGSESGSGSSTPPTTTTTSPPTTTATSPPSIATPTSTAPSNSPSRASLSDFTITILVGWSALRVVFLLF